VRTVAARVAGEIPDPLLTERLLVLLDDPEPHCRRNAALALAGHAASGIDDAPRARITAAAVRRVREAHDADDPWLRHALVMALAAAATAEERGNLARDADAGVRLLAVLAMRRVRDARLADALADPDRRIVLEAARAIWDVPVMEARDTLAEALLAGPRDGPDGDAFLRRAIAANERAGTADAAARLAALVTEPDVPEGLRRQAIDVLAAWSAPPPRDRVWGAWRPIENRDPAPARAALAEALPGILASDSGERIVTAALSAAACLDVPGIADTLLTAATDPGRAPATRAAALAALAATGHADSRTMANRLSTDAEPAVRAAARRVRAGLLSREPDEAAAVALAAEIVDATMAPADDDSTLREQQAAIDLLAALGATGQEGAAALVNRLEAGTLDPRLSLEVLEATGADRGRILAAALAGGGPLVGGDAARGRDVFARKATVECVRCHRVDGEGGVVGPALDGVAARHDRRGLLQSILAPSAALADGYRTTVLVTDDGRTVAGILRREAEGEVVILTGDGREVRVPTASVEERSEGASAMPADLADRLSPRELRDLVEWLASLRVSATRTAPSPPAP